MHSPVVSRSPCVNAEGDRILPMSYLTPHNSSTFIVFAAQISEQGTPMTTCSWANTIKTTRQLLVMRIAFSFMPSDHFVTALIVRWRREFAKF